MGRKRERRLAEAQARALAEANMIQQQQMAQAMRNSQGAVYPSHPQAMGQAQPLPMGTPMGPGMDLPPPYPGLGLQPTAPQQQVQVTQHVIHHEHECEECRKIRRRKLVLGLALGIPMLHHGHHHHHHHHNHHC